MPPEARPPLVAPALGLYGTLLAVAVAWRWGLHGESILYASEAAAREGLHPARDLALGAALAGVAVLGSLLAERYTAWARRVADELAPLVGPLSPAACLVLAAASGVGEEAFFRGALQPRVGLVAASLLFGLAHVPVTRALRAWMLEALAMGFALGWLFEATGALLAPLAAHVLVNALGLLTLRRRARSPRSGERAR